jgi:hypothetical protein
MRHYDIWPYFIDERYELVPKKEYKKAVLEEQKKERERNISSLTTILSKEEERLKKINKELDEIND